MNLKIASKTRFVFINILFILPLSHAKTNSLKKVTSTVPSMADIISASQDSDWRSLDSENTLYLELSNRDRIIIELAPELAPNHVENVKKLAREKYWDGLAIVRVQDNYVVQWADPNSEKPDIKRKIKTAKETLPAEFDQNWSKEKPFVRLKDGDTYAPEVGFVNSIPVGRDLKKKKAWLLHCYGAVGAGRDTSVDSGGGSELYAVIGHSPRHLDKNVTLIGRVVQGMDVLSSLPRGKGPMGFYEKTELNVTIKSIQIASDLPVEQRTNLEIIRTDSKVFQTIIESRRNRPEDWFAFKAGKIEICNIPIPVRTKIKK